MHSPQGEANMTCHWCEASVVGGHNWHDCATRQKGEIERLESWLAAIREATEGGDVGKTVRIMTGRALKGDEIPSRALCAYRARVPKIRDTSGTGPAEAGSIPDGSVGASCSGGKWCQCSNCQAYYAQRFTIKGWFCACGIFNGEEKETLHACRTCGGSRPVGCADLPP